VFQACTTKMNLADEVDLENFVSRPDPISNADIAVRPFPMHPFLRVHRKLGGQRI